MAKRLRSATRPPPANQSDVANPFARLVHELFERQGDRHRGWRRFGRRLRKEGQPTHFPGGGFVSIVTVLKDGAMVEVATVGREGMIGASAILNGTPPTAAAMVQGETDTCYRMPADAFREELGRNNSFHHLMATYAQALTGFIMQSTACNAVHSVEQRLARWLLLAQDRMGKKEFPLTQEFVAMMLGASRPTVTVVASTLQKAGLITYHRGLLKIVNREKLKSAACECYRTSTDLLKAVTRSGQAR